MVIHTKMHTHVHPYSGTCTLTTCITMVSLLTSKTKPIQLTHNHLDNLCNHSGKFQYLLQWPGMPAKSPALHMLTYSNDLRTSNNNSNKRRTTLTTIAITGTTTTMATKPFVTHLLKQTVTKAVTQMVSKAYVRHLYQSMLDK